MSFFVEHHIPIFFFDYGFWLFLGLGRRGAVELQYKISNTGAYSLM